MRRVAKTGSTRRARPAVWMRKEECPMKVMAESPEGTVGGVRGWPVRGLAWLSRTMSQSWENFFRMMGRGVGTLYRCVSGGKAPW
jgi:hypothetical protein